MRFALECRDKGAVQPKVVLDWPDSSNSFPYDEEFACAFTNGETKDVMGRGIIVRDNILRSQIKEQFMQLYVGDEIAPYI